MTPSTRFDRLFGNLRQAASTAPAPENLVDLGNGLVYDSKNDTYYQVGQNNALVPTGMSHEDARKILAGITPADENTRRLARDAYYGKVWHDYQTEQDAAQKRLRELFGDLSQISPNLVFNEWEGYSGYDGSRYPLNTFNNPTQQTAEQLARIFGGRAVYVPAVSSGPFVTPGHYQIEIDGRLFPASLLSNYFNNAAHIANLNRETILNNPGTALQYRNMYNRDLDPAEIARRYLNEALEAEARYAASGGAEANIIANERRGIYQNPPQNQIVYPTTPSGTAGNTANTQTTQTVWSRMDRPLPSGGYQTPDQPSPWLSGAAAGMNVPSGSPAAIQTAAQAANASPAQTGAHTGTRPQNINDLWRMSYEQYGAARTNNQLSGGVTETENEVRAPWLFSINNGPIRRVPGQVNYSTSYNPQGTLSF